MVTRAPEDPTEAVSKSVAGPGEIADSPQRTANVKVGDANEIFGYLIKWEATEWMYAEAGDFYSLDDEM